MSEISEYTPRQAWKKIYRATRVARRECHKAEIDMLIYGTGAVMVPDNGDEVNHVRSS